MVSANALCCKTGLSFSVHVSDLYGTVPEREVSARIQELYEATCAQAGVGMNCHALCFLLTHVLCQSVVTYLSV